MRYTTHRTKHNTHLESLPLSERSVATGRDGQRPAQVPSLHVVIHKVQGGVTRLHGVPKQKQWRKEARAKGEYDVYAVGMGVPYHSSGGKENRRRGNTMYMQWGWGASSRLCLRGVGATAIIYPPQSPAPHVLFHGLGYPFIRGCAV